MMRNKRPWIAAFALSLAGCGVGDSQPDTLAKAPQSIDQQMVSKLAIPLEEVPREFHRRAAQLLEDVRGSESAPTWETAILSPSVQPLYRPDMTSVAYYEFRVLVRQQPMGFIIVSAGDHDFPIAHWNFQGLSPTETLLQKAGSTATTFYKVDSLSYVAESPGGEMLANIGGLPNRIIGQDPSWLDRTFTPTDVQWVPTVGVADDSAATSGVVREEVSGPRIPTESIKLTGWSSWKELKTYYRESYGTMAESLRRQAAEEWETERLAQEPGEGLVVGSPLELALLYPQARFQLSGEGAQVVRPELVTTPSGSQLLVLTAFDATPGTETPLMVTLSYGNGVVETHRFVVLAREDVGTTQEPEADGSKSAASEGVHWTEMGQLGAWSPWTQYFAGTHDQQRLYGQISAGTSPNSSSCASGCGATAWAMLFGWGDKQAALGNAPWPKRWGMYRVNGGYGSNATAPVNQDTGVRNMTWEVRNRVNTFCFNGQGATAPWNMSNANGYLTNRSGATVSTHYNILGIHETRLRNKASSSIKDRKVPAIIGTGWLTHYPLAYGYRWRSRTVRKCVLFVCWNKTETQRNFYVNQGWYGNDNGWVGSGTWFAGQLYAN
ncbi:hypothetical protein [Hyalangium sp.]|uniref:hypothetical protein n=1 Tax=Hyalangium sp. TaxID=2028555 RepID=UPI002D6C16B9|nr:hypothetical protein [Hyalangium sp.]HYI02316.1 hypothetical protein [Hyalangium sp.]